MTRNQKELLKVAKAEIEAWHNLPSGLVIAILWAFIHRVTTGYSYEETFGGKPAEPDYEI